MLLFSSTLKCQPACSLWSSDPIRLHSVSRSSWFWMPQSLKRRAVGILQALIHPHDVEVEIFDESDELSEVFNSCRAQIMHHNQVSSSAHISEKCITLSFRCLGVYPQPVLNIDTPVDYKRVFNISRQSLPSPGTYSAVRRPEITSYSSKQSKRFELDAYIESQEFFETSLCCGQSPRQQP